MKRKGTNLSHNLCFFFFKSFPSIFNFSRYKKGSFPRHPIMGGHLVMFGSRTQVIFHVRTEKPKSKFNVLVSNIVMEGGENHLLLVYV